ncbi:MAG: phosphoribosylglycinamide formyltransferase [Deltaproteobacteria bacterium]|jgi:phosphoribosylglycinamide formyltransferase-1|nr:phosphoribosylglycinamide formyltransferase [Deltaproteobacteria bacterium]
MSLRLALIASGDGTNVQAILDAVQRQVLDASIRLVLCNRPGANVLERARRAGLPHMVLDHAVHPDRAAHDAAMIRAIRDSGADTVVLAGYMRLLTPAFLQAFPGRVLNIHPALLPAFPGLHGLGEAHAWGVKLAGCTVHFVDEAMDHGAIVIQAAAPRLDHEDLEACTRRIRALEHRIYPQALQWLASGRISLNGRLASLADAGLPLASLPATCLVWPPLEEGF